jgi:DNA-binding NtrC family response regulator
VNGILLCSHDPILIKSLYGLLRDEGHEVDIADHPADAVQLIFRNRYSAVIIEPEPFGLSIKDAVQIIKTVQPGIIVIFVGFDKLGIDVLNIDVPVDLEKFKKMIRDVPCFNRV